MTSIFVELFLKILLQAYLAVRLVLTIEAIIALPGVSILDSTLRSHFFDLQTAESKEYA